jgi:hypothetical protein
MSSPDAVSEAEPAVRMLRDDELDTVNGGIIAILIGLLMPEVPKGPLKICRIDFSDKGIPRRFPSP